MPRSECPRTTGPGDANGTARRWHKSFGVPSQTSAALISERGLSRGGALRLASQLPPRWNDAKPALDDISEAAARELGLTRADAARLAAIN